MPSSYTATAERESASSEEELDGRHYYTLAIQNTAAFHIKHIDSTDIPRVVRKHFVLSLPNIYHETFSEEDSEESLEGLPKSGAETLHGEDIHPVNSDKGLEEVDDDDVYLHQKSIETDNQVNRDNAEIQAKTNNTVRGFESASLSSEDSSEEVSKSGEFSKITYIQFRGLGLVLRFQSKSV